MSVHSVECLATSIISAAARGEALPLSTLELGVQLAELAEKNPAGAERVARLATMAFQAAWNVAPGHEKAY